VEAEREGELLRWVTATQMQMRMLAPQAAEVGMLGTRTTRAGETMIPRQGLNVGLVTLIKT